MLRELPSFYRGLCYIIEHTQTLTTMAEKITVTIEKKVMDIEFVKAWITSDYDYLDAIHTRSMSYKKCHLIS